MFKNEKGFIDALGLVLATFTSSLVFYYINVMSHSSTQALVKIILN